MLIASNLLFTFVENILQDMEESVRHGNPVELLSSCSKDVPEIDAMLLNPNKVISMVACRLVLYLGKFFLRVTCKYIHYKQWRLVWVKSGFSIFNLVHNNNN